jgi:hypothetical protein
MNEVLTLTSCRYDNPDVVAHVYRQLAEQGYCGVPIHNLYR